jgi:hypothetical protein
VKIARAPLKLFAGASSVTMQRTDTSQKKGSRNPSLQSKPKPHHNFPSAEIAGRKTSKSDTQLFMQEKAPVFLQNGFASCVTIPRRYKG